MSTWISSTSSTSPTPISSSFRPSSPCPPIPSRSRWSRRSSAHLLICFRVFVGTNRARLLEENHPMRPPIASLPEDLEILVAVLQPAVFSPRHQRLDHRIHALLHQRVYLKQASSSPTRILAVRRENHIHRPLMPQIHRVEHDVPLPDPPSSPQQQQRSLARPQQRRIPLRLTPPANCDRRRVLRVGIDHREVLHVEEALPLEEVEQRGQRGEVRPDQNEALRDQRGGQANGAQSAHVKISRDIEENRLARKRETGKR